jgi:hypothetical protein
MRIHRIPAGPAFFNRRTRSADEGKWQAEVEVKVE